ncbi:MAG: MBL fold metallo-hydrolase [Phycisphaerae bacterium]|nr:MBL fold metallo-hydrolase [Phycisphaerae bacterium]
MVPNPNKITFLGTGTSAGVPIIACDCAACTSSDPRDKRYRCSALLMINNKAILIDATPELRLQCLASNIRHLDACLITHAHADHIAGLDDLRRFNQVQKQLLDVFVSDRDIEPLRKMFGYTETQCDHFLKSDWPQLKFRQFTPGIAAFDIAGVPVDSFSQNHGNSFSVAYRIGDIAYCSDLSCMSAAQLEAVKGVKVLVLGALRHNPHSAHLSFAEAIELARQIDAEYTYFIHMSHDIVHARDNALLPKGIALAYDGLTVEF